MNNKNRKKSEHGFFDPMIYCYVFSELMITTHTHFDVINRERARNVFLSCTLHILHGAVVINNNILFFFKSHWKCEEKNVSNKIIVCIWGTNMNWSRKVFFALFKWHSQCINKLTNQNVSIKIDKRVKKNSTLTF